MSAVTDQFPPGLFSDFAGVAVAAGDAVDAGGVVAGDPVVEGAGIATVAGDGEAVGFALFVSGSALQAANVNEIASTKNSFFIMINLLLMLLRTSADNCRSNVCRALTGSQPGLKFTGEWSSTTKHYATWKLFLWTAC